MSKEAKRALEQYIPLAEFLSRCYGDNVEVALHDIADLDHSAVVIYNNHVSGRKTGAPMTYYGLKIIREKLYLHQDYMLNTQNILDNGKVVRSSTFFIKNNGGELIGTLCINVDVSHYVELGNLFERLARGTDATDSAKQIEHAQTAANSKETFPTTVDDLIEGTIVEFVGENGSINDLTPERKIELVSQLNDKGIFMFKGTVRKVSTALGVSEPTVYRYINLATQK